MEIYEKFSTEENSKQPIVILTQTYRKIIKNFKSLYKINFYFL